jgi:hypothetical protein
VQRNQGTTGNESVAWRLCAALRVHPSTGATILRLLSVGILASWQTDPSWNVRNLININIVMYLCTLLTVYRLLRLNCMSTSVLQYARYCRSFVPPSSIYIHNNSTISLQHYCITIIVFKVRSHARRPCAPTHLCRRPRTLPQSTNQRPCRTLYIRRFRS